jgi:hypothetical protein
MGVFHCCSRPGASENSIYRSGFRVSSHLQEASSINADLNEGKRSEESGLPSVATEISGGLSNVTDGAHTLRITSKSTATGTGG